MDYFCFEKIGRLDEPLLLDFEAYEHNLGLSIGKSLSEFRTCLNVNQKELADCFGVSVGQYRKYEAGIDIPKMHSAARWSVMTGAPIALLFKYTKYARFFNTDELSCSCIPYYKLVTKYNDEIFNSIINIFRNQDTTRKEKSNHNIDFSLALEDILTKYYPRVIKNLEAIRTSYSISQSDMAYLLGLSDNTYNKYVNNPNTISMPTSFYARTHAVLGLKSKWANTSKSYYAHLSQRRTERLAIIKEVTSNLSEDQIIFFTEAACYLSANLDRLNLNGITLNT